MFLSEKEKKISELYLNKGYVVQDVVDIDSLNWIRDCLYKIITSNLPKLKKDKPEKILNNIHKNISNLELNKFRLEIINKINSTNNFRENFYKISKPLVDIVVGNEIAMQLRGPVVKPRGDFVN